MRLVIIATGPLSAKVQGSSDNEPAWVVSSRSTSADFVGLEVSSPGSVARPFFRDANAKIEFSSTSYSLSSKSEMPNWIEH